MNEIYLKVLNKNNKDYKDTVDKFKDKTENINRSTDRGIVSDNNQSSILVKDNGNIQLSSGKTTSEKLTQDKIIQTAQEVHTITNRNFIEMDEIIVNNQKLNPQIVELSDTKVLFDKEQDAIGNLMMDGTVLVKTWDLNLKKYVLIRRKIRTPLFSHKLNYPEVPELIDSVTGNITDLSIESAKLLMENKKLKEKITAEEQAAKGGTTYDQGDYNNYLTDFLINSTSISSQGGYVSQTPISSEDKHTTNEDIITINTSGVDFIWPVPEYQGKYTSDFGYRNIGSGDEWHNGVDIPPHPTLLNKTKICASADGIVEDIRTLTGESLPPYTGYGKCVIIKHENGLKTLYAHMDKVLVSKGDTVVQGQWIGNMGSTGYSTGTHLHFSIWGNYNGKNVDIKPGLDPKAFIKPQN